VTHTGQLPGAGSSPVESTKGEVIVKKILFLDDMQERHDVFKDRALGCEIIPVYNYDEAVRAFEANTFDEVSLDHDLSTLSSLGIPDSEKTGLDVVLYMVEKIPVDKRPKKVYVHSWNPGGASLMVRELKKAGFKNVSYVPFKL
jgi:hypothetical protein